MARGGEEVETKNEISEEFNNELMPKYYEPNPETDQVLGNGQKLRDGMIVLPGASMLRVDIEDLDENVNIFSRSEQERRKEHARTRNRWARVSDLEYDVVNHVTSFLATYADGTTFKHAFGSSWPWIVKKSSIPGSRDKVAELTDILRNLISKYDYEMNRGEHEEAEDFLRSTAQRIYESF